jgi:hypothetical protein
MRVPICIMSVDSLGMTLGRHDSIRLWASRSDEWACLVISGTDRYCEIRLDRKHVEALRDHLPDVLAGLDRWAAEEEACAQAAQAGDRAEDAVTTALRQAELLEARGDHELAATLRVAAAEATAKAEEVDAALVAFGTAAADADNAAEAVLSASQCAIQAIGSTL